MAERGQEGLTIYCTPKYHIENCAKCRNKKSRMYRLSKEYHDSLGIVDNINERKNERMKWFWVKQRETSENI